MKQCRLTRAIEREPLKSREIQARVAERLRGFELRQRERNRRRSDLKDGRRMRGPVEVQGEMFR
jgi:hypothetical protein